MSAILLQAGRGRTTKEQDVTRAGESETKVTTGYRTDERNG